MAVRKVHVPERTNFDEEGDMAEQPDAIGKAQQELVDSIRLRNLQSLQTFQEKPPPAPPPAAQPIKAEERTNIDVAKMLEVMGTMYATSLANMSSILTTVMGQNAQRAADPWMQQMAQRIDAMQQMKPTDMVKETMALIGELRQQPGLGGAPESAAAGPVLLQLKIMEREQNERSHQWEVEMEERKTKREEEKEERKQRHELEMLKFQAEFGLKKEELQKGEERTNSALGTLKTLAASLIDSIDTGTAPVAAAATPPEPMPVSRGAEAPPISQPTQFQCSQCGESLTVPAGTSEFTCNHCGTTFK